MEGWTGMVYLHRGDMREVRNRAKFPRWANGECFRTINWNVRNILYHGFRYSFRI